MKIQVFFVTFFLSIFVFGGLSSMGAHFVVFGDLDQDDVVSDVEEFKSAFMKQLEKLKQTFCELYNEEGRSDFLLKLQSDITGKEYAIALLESLIKDKKPCLALNVANELLEKDEVKEFILRQMILLVKEDVGYVRKVLKVDSSPKVFLGFSVACAVVIVSLLYKQEIINYEMFKTLLGSIFSGNNTAT